MELKNTEKIATACQDGLMRVYDTCNPTSPPQTFNVAPNGSTETISKLAWSPAEAGLLIVGKKNGVLEKWDSRTSSGPVVSIAAPSGGENIMDLEVNVNHSLILVATGKKVLQRFYAWKYEINIIYIHLRIGATQLTGLCCVNRYALIV